LEVLILRRLSNRMRYSAAIDIDVPPISGRIDFAGHRRPVDANHEAHVVRRANPGLDNSRNLGAWLSPEADDIGHRGVGVVRKPFGAYASKTAWRHLPCDGPSRKQKLSCLLALKFRSRTRVSG
jgi:hypothetical protein